MWNKTIVLVLHYRKKHEKYFYNIIMDFILKMIVWNLLCETWMSYCHINYVITGGSVDIHFRQCSSCEASWTRAVQTRCLRWLLRQQLFLRWHFVFLTTMLRLLALFHSRLSITAIQRRRLKKLIHRLNMTWMKRFVISTLWLTLKRCVMYKNNKSNSSKNVSSTVLSTTVQEFSHCD